MIPITLRHRHILFAGSYIRRTQQLQHAYIVNQMKALEVTPIPDRELPHIVNIRAADLVWLYSQMTNEREGLSAKVAQEIISGDDEQLVPGLVAQLMAHAYGQDPEVASAANLVIESIMSMRTIFQQTIEADYIDGTATWLRSLP